jgi:lysophospholipase L1-like esterase
MKTRIQSGQTVLFIGDSITDCGRRGGEQPLGSGYVKLFRDMMILREPTKSIKIVNKGVSGDNVAGLMNRWSDDVLRNKPDWLSVKIGINDLHGYLRDQQNGISPRRFVKDYTTILDQTRARLPGCRLLLIDPFYISAETSPNSFRYNVLKLLPEYLAMVHQLSRKFKTRHIRTHDNFKQLLRHHEPDMFCQEPVHPNMTGHQMIAEAVYQAFCR